MNINKIKELESILSDVEESPTTSSDLMNDPKIKKYLNDIFNDTKEVKFSYIANISKNDLVNDLVYNYAQDNVNIIDDENTDEKETSLLALYLKDVSYYRLLTKEEEKQLTTKIKYGTKKEQKEATDELVSHNLRLVINIARRYTGRGVLLEDLIQEGNGGLMKAAEKFDVDKGYSFSTYATWWIRQSISRYIDDNSRTIRIPVHRLEQISKIKKTEEEYINKYGKIPSIEELANFIAKEKFYILENNSVKNDIKEESKYNYCLEIIKSVKEDDTGTISLNKEIRPNNEKSDGSELTDFIEDTKEINDPIINCERKDMHEAVQEVLNNQALSPKTREVIRLRFGIQNEKHMTNDEIYEILKHTKKEEEKEKILNDIIEIENIIKENPEEAKYLAEGCIEKSNLTPYQIELVELKYAIPSSGSKTINEIGQIFKVNKERIRQIEAKALRTLRQPAISNKLKYYK